MDLSLTSLIGVGLWLRDCEEEEDFLMMWKCHTEPFHMNKQLRMSNAVLHCYSPQIDTDFCMCEVLTEVIGGQMNEEIQNLRCFISIYSF